MASIRTSRLPQNNFRLCRLRKWTDFEGLGFNLDKSSGPPYCVEIVETNSPAYAGGLLMGDVILSVNNQNVSMSDLTTIISIIKNQQAKNEPVELLVIDKKYYNELQEKEGPFDSEDAIVSETPLTMPRLYKQFPKYTPRTCEIRLKSKDDPFGFSLAYGVRDGGANVRYILPESLADNESLRKCDRILEINDKFIDNESKDVIEKQLVKAKSKKKLKLYVVDTKTYKYFKQNKIPLESKKFKKSDFAKNLSSIQDSHSQDESMEDNDSEDGVPTTAQPINHNQQSTNTTTFDTQREHVDDIRLCTIHRADDKDTFGFKINRDEDDHSYRIEIMEGRNGGQSNASLAHVENDDYLIEINRAPTQGLYIDEVKKLICDTTYPKPLELLVADADTYEYYTGQNKSIHRNLSSVKKMPSSKPSHPSSIADSEHIKPVSKLIQNIAPKLPDGSSQSGISNLVIVPARKATNGSYTLRPVRDFEGIGFSVKSAENNTSGHRISKVTSGSPAYQAGLPVGYYIISINKENVANMDVNKFNQVLRDASENMHDRGDPLELEVIDEDSYRNRQSTHTPIKPVTPSTKPSSTSTLFTPVENYPEMRLCTIQAWPQYKELGFTIASAAKVSNMKGTHKIQQLDPNSPAAHTHILENDYIIEVDDENIELEDHDHVDNLIHDTYKTKQRIELLVINGEGYEWYQYHNYPIDSKSIRANIVMHETSAAPRIPTKIVHPNNDSVTIPNKPNNTNVTIRTSPNRHSTLQKNKGANNFSHHYSQDNLSQGVIDIVNEKCLLRRCNIKVIPGHILGLNLVTTEKENKHIVHSVEVNSPAAQAGVNDNDEIIEVNNERLDGKSHKDVTNLLKSASQSGRVDLLVIPSQVNILAKPSSNSMGSLNVDQRITYRNNTASNTIYDPIKPPSINSHRSAFNLYGDYSRRDLFDIRNELTYELILPTEPWPRECVVLRDSSSTRCGFRITRRLNHDTPIVAEVDRNSPAQRSGLTKGDHIIYVESHNVQRSSFEEIIHIIKRTFEENGQVTFVVLTSPGYHVLKRRGGYLEINPFSYQSQQADGIKPCLCKLKLLADDYDFGFMLQRKRKLFIQSIEIDSPADRYGMKEGDIVLELNGYDTRNLSMNKINDIIESSKYERKLDVLVIDAAGYEFSIKHAIPINSSLPLVEIKENPDNETRDQKDSIPL